MTDPITNADQAIEACAKVVEDQRLSDTYGDYSRGWAFAAEHIAAGIRLLKDRVASPSDRMLENANRLAGRMGAEFVPNEAPPDPAAGVTAREEALGDALFALSARLKDSGFLAEEGNHRAYEAVVRAFSQLSK